MQLGLKLSVLICGPGIGSARFSRGITRAYGGSHPCATWANGSQCQMEATCFGPYMSIFAHTEWLLIAAFHFTHVVNSCYSNYIAPSTTNSCLFVCLFVCLFFLWNSKKWLEFIGSTDTRPSLHVEGEVIESSNVKGSVVKGCLGLKQLLFFDLLCWMESIGPLRNAYKKVSLDILPPSY